MAGNNCGYNCENKFCILINMENKNILEEIREILQKSRREPSKFIELIAYILDMNSEGEIASYPKIVRRLWPEEWQQAEDKVKFEIAKWDLLRKRRHEINERIFNSYLCFYFFIGLSQAKKEFYIITESKEAYSKRHEELQNSLVRASSQKERESIKAQVTELTDKFRELEKGQAEELTDAGGIIKPGPVDAKEEMVKPWLKRWKWAAAGIAAVLVIVAAGVVIRNLYLHPVLPPEDFEMPDISSIAVLPFKSMSEDPELKYFCDGLTEGIITTLCKTPKITVIASTSSSAYKGKTVSTQQIGKKLNARYILEGSARKIGNNIRISAQLIDATSGKDLWAERYARSFHELFAVQDEIILKILTELQVKLTEGEMIRLLVKGTDNLEAYLRFLQGYSSNLRANPDENVYARRMFQEAIALDPEYAEAYAYLAFTYLVDVRHGAGESPQKSVEQAFNLVQKALEKDESSATVIHMLSAVYLFQGKYDEAIAKAEQAYALEPNNYEVVVRLGLNLMQAGMPEKAIPCFEKAIRLNPISPHLNTYTLGTAYCHMGKYEMAIPFLEKDLSFNPNNYLGLLNLAICYAGVGREDEARACASRALIINPMMTIKKHIMAIPKKNKAILKDFAKLLRKAGLPD